MSQPPLSHSLFSNREHRQAASLVIAGSLCVAIALGDGGVVFGKNPLSLAGFLVPVGFLYLVFAVLTYRSPPATVRTTVVGALAASGLVFSIGTAGLYYELVLHSGEYLTTALLSDIVGYSAVPTLFTLPVSAGWIAGTLISQNKPLRAVGGVGIVTVFSGAGGAALLIALQSFSGAAAGFAQVGSFIAVIGAAGLGYLPLKVTAQPRERRGLQND